MYSTMVKANLRFHGASRVLSELVHVVMNYSLAHESLLAKFYLSLIPSLLKSITEKISQTGNFM